MLDPGLAFGTGGHETTSLCLEALDKLVAGGERVLDIGTGSGILAIAALKLGAAAAEGVDIDPVAVRTACENAALNEVDGRFTGLVGGPVRPGVGQIRHCHRQHRGQRHYFAGPGGAGPAGGGRALHRQRHHRHPRR